MTYKPKYCCQCGEKIDRINWKLWNSRRFCELCETDFKVYDWIVRGLFGAGLLLGLFGIGSFFQKPEKPLSLAQNQFVGAAPANKVETVVQKSSTRTPTVESVQPSAQPGNLTSQIKSQATASQSNSNQHTIQSPTNESAEMLYFCGAQTKKGTLCSRRVKGGGRCWQHAGQTAMLPQNKLAAN